MNFTTSTPRANGLELFFEVAYTLCLPLRVVSDYRVRSIGYYAVCVAHAMWTLIGGHVQQIVAMVPRRQPCVVNVAGTTSLVIRDTPVDVLVGALRGSAKKLAKRQRQRQRVDTGHVLYVNPYAGMYRRYLRRLCG